MSKETATLVESFGERFSDRSSTLLGSTIPDHHLMKVKWWFFFYRTATVTDTDIYHIKDLEDYGDIVLKNIYPLHKRGKQLLVLINRLSRHDQFGVLS